MLVDSSPSFRSKPSSRFSLRKHRPTSTKAQLFRRRARNYSHNRAVEDGWLASGAFAIRNSECFGSPDINVLDTMTEGIGFRLRAIRRQWQLSLREVEERSMRVAHERGSQSYQVSASWLDRLEREEHELSVNKLIALADIYHVPTEQLLRSMYPANAQPLLPKQHPGPNATLSLTEGALEAQATYWLPDTLDTNQPPDETTLLPVEKRYPVPYKRGIVGKRDLTLDPMIPPGSILQIDTRKRAISRDKDWTHEFQRPIYFFLTRDGYACGWCELDKNSEWLTLIPHPLSGESYRRWRYRKEIESIGRVIGAVIRFPESTHRDSPRAQTERQFQSLASQERHRRSLGSQKIKS